MSETPAILILGLNYAPEEIGIGPYSAGLAEHLAASGHEVQVVAGRPYYPQWQPHAGYRWWWNSRREHAVTVTRCPHYIPRNPSGLRRVLHHLSFALASLPVMLRAATRRPKIVLAVAPSLIAAPVAWLAARLSRAKLWLHVQDFEVDAALATGLASKGSAVTRLGSALERFLLSRADLVTTISPQMCRRLVEKGVKPEHISELRNWANHLEDIARADGTALRDEWELADRFVALYSGNIANKQGLGVVIEAARSLADNAAIAFVICGSGPKLEHLKEQAEGLANIQFHPLQPPDRFAQLMRMADCHLLPQLAGAADLVLPSKLANMLASGRPIVATAGAGTGIAEEVEGCGIVVDPEDPGALAEAIKALANNADRADDLGRAGAARARQRWARVTILRTSDRLVAKLVEAEQR